MLKRVIGGKPESAGSELQREVRQLRSENAELRAELEVRDRQLEKRDRQLEKRDQQIDELLTVGENLRQQIHELQARLGQNSRNSSKPPSSDPPETPARETRKKSDRKRGGQPGHDGTTWQPPPDDELDDEEHLRPNCCASCGEPLVGDDPEPLARYVVDIPTPRLITVKYWLHELRCSACGEHTRAEPPAGVSVGQSPFGARLHALSATLVGRFKQSKRGVASLLELLFGVSISPGTVCAMERRMSAVLEDPVEHAQEYIRSANYAHMDETSWRMMRNRAWLWVAATAKVVTFAIARRRSSQVAKRILGEAFSGIVCSDRWSAYTWLESRQLCWAHLLRDFVAMEERFNSAWHGRRLAKTAREVLAIWAMWNRGEIDWETMQARIAPLREQTHRYLKWTINNAPGPTARTKAREIFKLKEHLWTFAEVKGVPPTNNLAERLLRYAVIWRKLSHGTDSLAGSKFVGRLLSVVTSLQLQERDVFAYLCDAISTYGTDRLAPSILPDAAGT